MHRQQQLLQATAMKALNSQQAADVIELKDIQKLQELNVEDRYNVLEYLVKELIGIKKQSLIESSSNSVPQTKKKRTAKKVIELEDVDEDDNN